MTTLCRSKTEVDLKTVANFRPQSSAGRPVSGVVRPETHARPGTMDQTLRTSRTARTARATSSSSARFVRLGTVTFCSFQAPYFIFNRWDSTSRLCLFQASMLSQSDGPFVNLSRLNVDKYAADPQINRTLFDYVFYHEGDMKIAHHVGTFIRSKFNSSDFPPCM